MKLITAVLVSVTIFCSAAFASGNGANDYLLSISPNMGMKSTGVAANVGNWSVKCADGRSFSVGVHADGTSKVLECSVLKAVAHVDCFKGLDVQ